MRSALSVAGLAFSLSILLAVPVAAAGEDSELEFALLRFHNTFLRGTNYETAIAYPRSVEYQLAWVGFIIAVGEDFAFVFVPGGQAATIVETTGEAASTATDVAKAVAIGAERGAMAGASSLAVSQSVSYGIKGAEKWAGTKIPLLRTAVKGYFLYRTIRQEETRILAAVDRQREIQKFVTEVAPVAAALSQAIALTPVSDAKRAEYRRLLEVMLPRRAEIVTYRQLVRASLSSLGKQLELELTQHLNPGAGTNYTIEWSLVEAVEQYIDGESTDAAWRAQLREAVLKRLRRPESVPLSETEIDSALQQLQSTLVSIDDARIRVNRYGGGSVAPAQSSYLALLASIDRVANRLAPGASTPISGWPASTGTGPAVAAGPLVAQLERSGVVFIMDASGSMEERWEGRSKLDSAKAAVDKALDLLWMSTSLLEDRTAALVSFADRARIESPLGTEVSQTRTRMAGLKAGGGTNIGEGLEKALAELRGATKERTIILLSDGRRNRGLSADAIVSGPVVDARKMGTKIYTVGVGDPAELDEHLLRRIADETGGQYYHAASTKVLLTTLRRTHHGALGSLLLEESSTIRQGETTRPRKLEVPFGTTELHASLSWPGSDLTIALVDPGRRLVDVSYPNAQLLRRGTQRYVLVSAPMPGTWAVSVVGLQVPVEGTMYHLVASARRLQNVTVASGTAPVRRDDNSLAWILVGLQILIVTLLVSLVVAARRGPRRAAMRRRG